jgi:hypothetical protein
MHTFSREQKGLEISLGTVQSTVSKAGGQERVASLLSFSSTNSRIAVYWKTTVQSGQAGTMTSLAMTLNSSLLAGGRVR